MNDTGATSGFNSSKARPRENLAGNQHNGLSGDWRITQDLWGTAKAQALLTAVELDIFSIIHAGNATSPEVAQAAGASEPGVRRLLDALVACEYLRKKGDAYQVEESVIQFLVRGQIHYMGPAVKRMRAHFDSWMHLTEVIKGGQSHHKVNQVQEGGAFFADHVQAIFPSNLHAAKQLVRALPQRILNQIGRVLDIGCGAGVWGIAFAAALPKARVTALDFPEVIKIAKTYAGRFGVDHQFDFVEGDWSIVTLEQQAYDLVVLGYVLHNEGIEHGRDLIRRSYDALRPGGWLLISDIVANDDRTSPLIPVLFGLNMLVLTEHGDVFTEAETNQALRAVGFGRIDRLASPATSLFLLAEKPVADQR